MSLLSLSEASIQPRTSRLKLPKSGKMHFWPALPVWMNPPSGEEVTIEYHTTGGNAALLLDYGFAEDARPGQLGSEVWGTGIAPMCAAP